ncbi:HET-domain-containing protein [Cubamyces sp. BRFM 1775]|nr:HET-domain-containing protein [Cubamyces sp. BRFM 1775]
MADRPHTVSCQAFCYDHSSPTRESQSPTADSSQNAAAHGIDEGCRGRSPDAARCDELCPDYDSSDRLAHPTHHLVVSSTCTSKGTPPFIGTPPDVKLDEVFTPPPPRSSPSVERSLGTNDSIDAPAHLSPITPQRVESLPQTKASRVSAQRTLQPATPPLIEPSSADAVQVADTSGVPGHSAPSLHVLSSTTTPLPSDAPLYSSDASTELTPETSRRAEYIPQTEPHGNRSLPTVQLEKSSMSMGTPNALPFDTGMFTFFAMLSEPGSFGVLPLTTSTSPAVSSTTSTTANPSPADAVSDHMDIPLGSSTPRPYSRASMRPDDVCAHCWEGVFAWVFGSRNRGGNRYSISHDELLTCRSLNCMWYRCLEQDVFDEMLGWFEGGENDRLGVEVRSKSTDEDDLLDVTIDGERSFEISLQADNSVTGWIEDWAGTVLVKISDALAWAEACTEECAREHKACRKFRDWSLPAASLPRRLIDCSDPDHPRIVDTDSWDQHVEYVALSYVWGEEQPNRTTITNLAAYHENINVRLLPKTIVDAIKVVHGLGLRYLWVDSICIVQDSGEDKHRELARMRDVYCRALLTIDAAGAYSASEGFLADDGRATLLASDWLPFAWSRRHNRNPRHLMDLFERTPGLLAIDEEIPHYAESFGYTAKRAWCLQESLMSGRLLHFKSDLLQFSCRTSLKRFFDSSVHPSRMSMIPDVIFQPNPSITLDSQGRSAIRLAWMRIVQDYMLRSLSYPEDKLVACAGVAELFGRALGSQTEYLAGLWRDSLLFDLLWFTRGRKDYPEGYGDALAPSWSWATSDGFFFHPYDRQESVVEELAEVVECAVTPEDPALPFGRVTGGHLILRTPLLGPLSVEDLRSQGATGLYMDYHRVGREKGLMDTSVWIVPLLHTLSDPLRVDHGHTGCLLVRLCTGQPAVPPACSSSECPYAVYQRAGYCEFYSSRGESEGIIAPLVDSLENKVDGRWDFPRTVIKLV